MGNNSITQELNTEEVKEQDLDWEQGSYQIGCAVARQEALQRLKGIDERLFKSHPVSWEAKGFNERTLTTRFGEITIRRRLYQDEKGNYHYLLDEYLDWTAHQLVTPSLQESLVELATEKSFIQVSKTLSNLTASVLSTSTIHRLLQKTSKRAIEKEKEDCQAIFERGELPSRGKRKIPLLFSEYDGIWVHLQREKQEQYELKNGIAYEGWRRLPGKEERYSLVNKKVYCQADDDIPFWEGATVEWCREWDLSSLEGIVIGGDGAKWIDNGIGEFAGAMRQLDGYHLARACGQGWQGGEAIYQAIRAGETETARRLMDNLIPRKGKGVEKAWKYVAKNVEKGRDWRTQSKLTGRGMGTMESNEDKLVANRMKKRGLSWTIEGAYRMHKAIQLAANGEIKVFCRRQKVVEKKRTPATLSSPKSISDGHQKWLEASIPALNGPHASRPWVEKLRNMAYGLYPVN